MTKQDVLELKQKTLEEKYRKRIVELEDELKLKDAFLVNMTHEVRTPVHCVLAMAEALYLSWDILSDAKRKDCARMISESRERLLQLLSNLLDLSKITHDKVSFELKYHDIKALLLDVIDEFKHVHSDINLQINSDVDPQVLCDDSKLKQVIRNLIANSTKHGGGNQPITISVSNVQDKKKTYLQISVRDKGLGVPENEMQKIFGTFYESTRTRGKSKGTGLGLAICKRIISSHKGKIWVENNKDTGSTFHFTIPYNKSKLEV